MSFWSGASTLAAAGGAGVINFTSALGAEEVLGPGLAPLVGEVFTETPVFVFVAQVAASSQACG